MGMLRPIPRSLLGSSCVVYPPLVCGGFGEGRAIAPVRFERVHEAVDDAHRAGAVRGVVYVDAVMSEGAFEVAAGSRIAVDGASMLMARVRRFEGAWGRVRHWELEVR